MGHATTFFSPVRTVCVLMAFVLAMSGLSAEARDPRFMSLDEVRSAATAGDPEAQYELALRYETGRDAPQNYNGAKQWYQAAAEQGHAPAMFEMGMLHAMGRMTLDYDQAAAQSRYWFDRLENVGVIVDDEYYIRRDRIERKDISDANLRFEWLHRVAENGHREAQRYLGYQYDLGVFSRDCVKAARWYEKAAQQGDRFSQEKMGVAYAICAGLPIDEAKSVYWFKQAALQGDIGAQISVSAAYRLGRGVSKDDRLAAYWIGQAAEQGSSVAQFSLGERYRDGRSVPHDQAMALAWFEKSAAQGYDKAQAELARLHRQPTVEPSAAETLAMLAAFWIAVDVVSDITAPDPEPSPHSTFVQEAINKCRNEVHRRMVRCYSSMTIPGCTLAGECTYEWTCQTGNKGRGKCSPRGRYTDERVDYYCDPLDGTKYTTRDAVYASSCH